MSPFTLINNVVLLFFELESVIGKLFVFQPSSLKMHCDKRGFENEREDFLRWEAKECPADIRHPVTLTEQMCLIHKLQPRMKAHRIEYMLFVIKLALDWVAIF